MHTRGTIWCCGNWSDEHEKRAGSASGTGAAAGFVATADAGAREPVFCSPRLLSCSLDLAKQTMINLLGSKDAMKKVHLACNEVIDDNQQKIVVTTDNHRKLAITF